MNFTNSTFAHGLQIGQTIALHASNGQALPGHCSDKTSSEKMNHLPKWPMVPLMILLALCTAKHANAQASNYISVPSGGNIYPYVTPPSIAPGATFNNFFGTASGLAITSGAQNSIFGANAGLYLTTGNNNTFIGTSSGANAGSNMTANNNTYVGINSGYNDQTGASNTALGSMAGFGASGLTDATAIGANATASNSDEMVFGDGNVTGWGFGEDVTATGAFIQVKTGATTYVYMDNGGVWHMSSDGKLKENFHELNEGDILRKVMNLPITQWNYIKDPSRTHIGPMAQDFYATFHLDNDSTHISEVDPGNIALVAIKALGKQNVDLVNQVQGITSQNQALQTQNAQLQNSVSDLQDKFNTVLAEIENLKTLQAQCCGSMGVNTQTGSNSINDNSGNGQPSLAQNAPNPFSQNTVISYYLPASMPNAVITIRSMTGTTLQSFNITSSGNGQITVSQGTLAPATYEYDMIVNGKLIDSKKMIIVGE